MSDIKNKKNTTTKMSLEECIDIAKEMQKWRKGESPYDGITPEDYKPMPYSPKEFGDAIDSLIRFAESSIRCNDLFTIISNIKKANKL